MNTRTQTRLIDELIAFDEGSVNALHHKIHTAERDQNGSSTTKQCLQIAAWKGSLLTLAQGLEGLRLKHDSLADAVRMN